ncbi:MAG: hypothetical protein R3299_08635 [Arenibacter sp.]|nr:hypothetical protein [Arenibacter sp.]
MRTVLSKNILAILLAIPIFTYATDGIQGGKYSKEKTIKKEYSVNSDALLKVKNRYGNLNITSWNENRVLIQVQIKTTGDNEEKVQRKLDDIDIQFENSKSRVSATTVFNQSKSKWSWGWGNNNNVNMQVNYTIKIPVKNSVDLNNDYGNILLDRIDGHATINCDYGRLELGELHGRNNELSFDYTSRSTIEYMKSGSIKADYSDFTISKAGDLRISADYTNTKVGIMENLTFNNDYGKLEIGEVGNVEGNGDYVTIALGRVHGNLDLKSSYGAIKIDEITPEAGNLQLQSSYTGITIGYAADYHFNFEIEASYAGLRGQNHLTMEVSTEKSTEKYYKGYYGKPSSGKSVFISSKYGGISLKKNQ